MTKQRLRKSLWVLGWAAIAGYVIQILATNALRLHAAREFGANDEFLTQTSMAYLIGAAFESPLHLTSGFLCLWAAMYLKRTPLSDVFE